jgi:hypothetical protein
MNIKSSFFYAALAACLGTGFGTGMAVTQSDVDRAVEYRLKGVQCEQTEDDRRFNSTSPQSSPAKGY